MNDRSALHELWADLIIDERVHYDFYMCPTRLKPGVAEVLLGRGRPDLVTEEYGGTMPNVKP